MHIVPVHPDDIHRNDVIDDSESRTAESAGPRPTRTRRTFGMRFPSRRTFGRRGPGG